MARLAAANALNLGETPTAVPLLAALCALFAYRAGGVAAAVAAAAAARKAARQARRPGRAPIKSRSEIRGLQTVARPAQRQPPWTAGFSL